MFGHKNSKKFSLRKTSVTKSTITYPNFFFRNFKSFPTKF